MYGVLWRIHAILMSSSFIALAAGIVISILYKKRKWRYKAHQRLGIYAGTSGLTALILAGIMVQAYSGYHLNSTHAILGLTSGLLLILTPIAGLRMKKAVNKKRLRLIHRILGGLTAVMMLITILLGLGYTGIIYLPI
ncbi:MAG TPA: hypothetical protein DCO79_10785 [Spirochaeta sp.]|nr:hypothetical protein [Spirochaeta sp.]